MDGIPKKQSVLGLTLQLQKYGVGSIEQKSKATQLIWGHYDNLIISPVINWLDYSPKVNLIEEPGNEKNLVNYYPIKLLFPILEQKCEYPPLFYNEWKEFDSLLEDYPCMSIVLLNLTSDYKATAGDFLLEDFLEQLKKHCHEEIFMKIHCCVMPTLGYSDFCVLMAGTEWNSALSLVENLHRMTMDDGKPILATDYIMPVLHRSPFILPASNFNGCELSVRVNLKPGITLRDIENYIPKDVIIYRPSGGSDYVFQAKEPNEQSELLTFLLNTGGENIVMDITSTLRYPLGTGKSISEKNDTTKKSKSRQSHVPVLKKKNIPFIIEFRHTIRQYKEKLEKKQRHLRQVNSLCELANNIESICNQPHTEEIQEIMQNLIENFSDCLSRCSAGMEKSDWHFDEMELQVSTLCNIIDSFLADLSRADCFFIERERYNHASISSATSLLLAYNFWLNQFTRDVRDATRQTQDSDYTFLVTSGGRDRTQTYNAFHFLEPEDDSAPDDIVEKLPLVTQMSELSLFDFSGTILRSFHECMHFCGIRHRKERVNYLADFVTSILSETISETLFAEKSELQYALNICQVLGPENIEDNLKDELYYIFRECLNKLQNTIKSSLMEYLTPDGEFIKAPKSYLAREVREWMYDNLLEAFSGYFLYPMEAGPDELSLNFFAKDVYNAVQDAFIRFHDKCGDLMKKHQIETAVFSFERNKYEIFKQENRQDPFILHAIQMVFSRLLISIPPQRLFVVQKEDAIAFSRTIPYILLSKRNLVKILKNSTDIFSESFSDVMACKILDAKIDDYMLMHVYEDWDLRLCLEKEMANNYRIPAVLMLCFPDAVDTNNWKLTSTARITIENALNRLKAHGMTESKVEASLLCEKVNELLGEFGRNKEVAKPLLRYLQECVEAYKNLNAFGELKSYAETFQDIRLLSVEPDGEDTNRKIVSMYYALIKRNGGERADEVQQMAGSAGK